MWNELIVYPITNLLVLFYGLFFHNLGLAIIALTVFLRVILLPFMIPSMKAMEKQKLLQPKMDELKRRHEGNKEAFVKAQMELYRREGVNPAAGCLPQLLPIAIFFALYQVFGNILRGNGDVVEMINRVLYFDSWRLPSGSVINLAFGPWDLAKPDRLFILPVLAAALQFISSKLMMPSVKEGGALSKNTPDKTDDLMYTMQNQSLYLMPLMTLFVGFSLQSGLMLSWLVTTAATLAQQLAMSRERKGLWLNLLNWRKLKS